MVGVAGAGRSGAPGEDAGLVPDGDHLPVPVRHHRSLDGVVGGGVEHRFDDHSVRVAAPVRSWPGVIRWLPCSRRAVRASWARWTYSTILRWRCLVSTGSTAVGSEVEGELAAGELTDRHRASYVEGLGRAEVLQLGGDRLDRGLQLEGVGEVELAVDGEGAVVGVHLPGLDGEVAAVRVLEATGLGFVGHVAADRLVDQPVERTGADPVRGRRHVPVHKRRGVLGEEEGLLGDPAGQPRPQVPGLDPPPDPGEAVPELEGVADVPLPRIGRHTERGGELGDRELRHQRRTLTGDRHPGLAVGTRGEGLGLQDRVDGVHRRPVHRRAQQPGLRRGPRSPASHARQPAPRRRCRSRACVSIMGQLKHRPPTVQGPEARG